MKLLQLFQKSKSVLIDGFRSKRKLFMGGGLVLLILVLVSVRLLGMGGGTGALMTAVAESRPFVALVVEKGTLRAAETYTYHAPRLRRGGGQVILELAAEGTVVQPGDLIVRFDSSSLEESIANQRNDVAEIDAELRKTIAQQESQMAGLQASYEQVQHSHEQAQLRMETLQFESVIQQEQERYNFLKSELSLERSKETIDTQVRLNKSALQRLQIQVDRDHQELAEMIDELDQTELLAVQPGLVIQEMTWGQSGRTKLKAGDSAYSGQAVISVPDLTTMTVEVQISELDIRRVSVGQEALVRIDAYPETLYTAKVTEISPLARRRGASQMKVFDCTVSIVGTDLSLRPGMTALASIITNYQPDKIVVPIEAIFRREGKSVVFSVENGIEEIEVVLGDENGNYVIVEEGLVSGTIIALRDPYLKLETLQSAGTDALLAQRESGADGVSTRDIGMMIMERMGRGGRGGDVSMRIFH